MSHIDWKRDIQDPKYWLGYVDKGLDFTVIFALNRAKTLTNTLNKIRIKYYSFLRFVSIISNVQFPCKLQPETKTAPIISLKISWFEDSCRINKRTYKLVFELNLQLTLNITFNKLFTRDYFGTCHIYHLMVEFEAFGDKWFKYCGIMSHFSVFPPSRNVSFYLDLHFRKPVFIDVMFNVMSTQLIESHRTETFGFYINVCIFHTFYQDTDHILPNNCQ